jgi:hypothetical protein
MDRDAERAIEWECQKIMRRYYYHVDRREFEKAAVLFTEDVDWLSHGVKLDGRDELVKALYASLEEGTIRHVLTNSVTTVADEDHAICRSYNTLYYTADTEYQEGDKPVAMEGPHRLLDSYAELTRTSEGWRISKRRSLMVFRRDPDEPVRLETWGASAGKT